MHCRRLPLCLGSGGTCDPFPGCCRVPPLTPTSLLPLASHSCDYCCCQWWPFFRGQLYTRQAEGSLWPPLCTEALGVQSPHFCPKLVASEAWALVTDPQGLPLLSRCSLLCAHSSGSLAGPMPIPAHQEVGCPSCVWAGTQEALRPGSQPILVPRLPSAHGGGCQANQVSSQQSLLLLLLWPSHPLAHLPAERPTLWVPSSRVSFPLARGCCVHSVFSVSLLELPRYCGAFDGSAPGLPWEV